MTTTLRSTAGLAVVLLLLGGCGGAGLAVGGVLPRDAGGRVDSGVNDAGADAGVQSDSGTGVDGGDDGGLPPETFERVILVMLENHDASEVYGSSAAPYLNGLMSEYAYSEKFADVLSLSIPSEPHYVWLEAGTNAFSDVTFTGDGDATASNSTTSTQHLTTLLDAAGVSWMTYQEGLGSGSGACPIASSGQYAAKHDPFVFFKDVSGNPPAKTTAACTSHHRALTSLAADLTAGTLARYVLITPDLCHDMHGGTGCASGSTVTAGDTWLAGQVPALLSYAKAHRGLVLLVWDEGDKTLITPFLVLGNHLKGKGYVSNVTLNLSAVTKSLQQVLGVAPDPVDGKPAYLGHAADLTTNDLSDFFTAGAYP